MTMKLKPVIIACVLILGTVMAAIWFSSRTPYDLAKVHPELRELRQPFQSVQPHSYFDGGSVGLSLVDAVGKKLDLAIPVNTTPPYSKLYFGATHLRLPGAVPVEVPYTQDTRNYIITLMRDHGERGFDRDFALGYLSGTLWDKLRIWINRE